MQYDKKLQINEYIDYLKNSNLFLKIQIYS